MQASLVAIISQGCAANFGDGEKMARALAAKFRIAFDLPTEEAPAAIYLNVCTAKGISGSLKLLRRAHDAFPDTPIYITGCATKDLRETALAFLPSVQFTELAEIERNLKSDAGQATPADITLAQNTLRTSRFTGIVNIEQA